MAHPILAGLCLRPEQDQVRDKPSQGALWLWAELAVSPHMQLDGDSAATTLTSALSLLHQS